MGRLRAGRKQAACFLFEVHMATVCRYRCEANGPRCCFECDQVVKDRVTGKDKRCPDVCTSSCWLKSGDKPLKVVKQYE